MLLHPKGPEVTPSFGGGHTCLFCRLSSVPLPHFGLVTLTPDYCPHPCIGTIIRLLSALQAPRPSGTALPW